MMTFVSLDRTLHRVALASLLIVVGCGTQPDSSRFASDSLLREVDSKALGQFQHPPRASRSTPRNVPLRGRAHAKVHSPFAHARMGREDAWMGKRWRTDPTPRRGRQVRGPSV